MENLDSEPPPVNEEPIGADALVSGFVTTALDCVTAYGWYIIIGIGICIYFWKARFEEQWTKWRQQQAESRESSEYHKNPEIFIERQEAMAAVWKRMQEKNDQLSMQHAIKLKEKEEQKRLEKIKEWEKSELGQGTRLRSKANENDSAQTSALGRKKGSKDSGRLRAEYNPLMGSGSGTTYRSDRRNCSSDGGGG